MLPQSFVEQKLQARGKLVSVAVPKENCAYVHPHSKWRIEASPVPPLSDHSRSSTFFRFVNCV